MWNDNAEHIFQTYDQHQDVTVSERVRRVSFSENVSFREKKNAMSILTRGVHRVMWFAAENVEVKAGESSRIGGERWPHQGTRRGYNGPHNYWDTYVIRRYIRPHNSVGLEETEAVLGAGGCIPLLRGGCIILPLGHHLTFRSAHLNCPKTFLNPIGWGHLRPIVLWPITWQTPPFQEDY